MNWLIRKMNCFYSSCCLIINSFIHSYVFIHSSLYLFIDSFIYVYVQFVLLKMNGEIFSPLVGWTALLNHINFIIFITHCNYSSAELFLIVCCEDINQVKANPSFRSILTLYIVHHSNNFSLVFHWRKTRMLISGFN